MRVGDFCIRDVVQCRREASALELSQLMRESHVGDVVVVDQPNGKKIAVGIVTDRDLVIEVMAKERDPALVTARELMAGSSSPSAKETTSTKRPSSCATGG